jgi:hypothetical protein
MNEVMQAYKIARKMYNASLHCFTLGTCLTSKLLEAGRSRVRFMMMSLEFLIDIFLPAALWPWCRLSL